MPEIAQREAEVSFPQEFFLEILPGISDVAVLKLVLLVTYLSTRKRDKYGVPLNDLLQPEVMRSIIGTSSPEPGEMRLQGVADKAVGDGVLFRLKLRRGGSETICFLPVNSGNRELLGRLQREDSDVNAELDLSGPVAVSLYRPNIFALYEQHLGPLNPLLAEELRDAERSYPRAWIEQAIDEAVHYNKRNWRYVQAVLSQWEDSGGPSGITR